MNRQRTPLTFSLIIFFILFGLINGVDPANAQSGTNLVINYIDSDEQEEALQLDIYFNILNEQGVVLSGNDIDSASLVLDDGERYEPAIVQPDTPIFVTLVLDTSGSMDRSMDQMKAGAISAIRNAPPQAVFSVVEFNETAQTMIAHTSNRIEVINAVQQVEISNGGTCLYDALYAAVQGIQSQAAASPESRRSVVLFTDGRDERTQGAGDLCSTFSLEQVYRLARTGAQVPINTIGLQSNDGNINEAELEEIAGLTGGLSIAGSVNQLESAFAYIMDGLRNQFVARVLIYPEEGERSATLNIGVGRNGLATASTKLTASRTWIKRDVAGISVSLGGVKYDSELDEYRLTLPISRPEEIAEVAVSIWDDSKGTQIETYSYTELSSTMNIPLPTNGMEPEQAYVVRVGATLLDGSIFVNGQGSQILVEHQIAYLPESKVLRFFIESQAVDLEQQLLVLEVVQENGDRIVGYEGWIENQETQIKVLNFSSPTGSKVPVQLGDIPAGKYQIILRGVDEAGNEVGITAREFVYVLPAGPGFFRRMFGGLFTNLWILGLVLGAIGGLIAFLVYRSREKKKLTGTPFLSGNIRTTDKPVPLSRTMVQPALKRPMPTLPAHPAGQKKVKPTLFIKQSGKNLLGSQLIQLNHFPFNIGRKGCDYNLNSKTISRTHVQIVEHDGQYTIVDVGSSNGTWVNEQKLSPNMPIQLENGMELRFGADTIAIFETGFK